MQTVRQRRLCVPRVEPSNGTRSSFSNTRVARLRAGTGGVPKLDATTVFDDLLANRLKGGLGLDWFFQGDLERITGRSPDEFVDAI